MFPGFFEWVWDGGHMLFMGGLWYALSIMGLGITYCLVKSVIECSKESEGHH